MKDFIKNSNKLHNFDSVKAAWALHKFKTRFEKFQEFFKPRIAGKHRRSRVLQHLSMSKALFYNKQFNQTSLGRLKKVCAFTGSYKRKVILNKTYISR